MNFKKLLLFLLFFAGSSCDGNPLACDLHGLTSAERQRHQALAERLEQAVIRNQERPRGFALTLDAARMPLPELREWAALESRCCPFLRIDLRVKRGEVVLELSGKSAQTKEFLRQEIAAVQTK